MLYLVCLAPCGFCCVDVASSEEPDRVEMFHLSVPSVLCGAEPGHVVQCEEVEVASWTLEEHRVREANRTLQQGQVAGSTPGSASSGAPVSQVQGLVRSVHVDD